MRIKLRIDFHVEDNLLQSGVGSRLELVLVQALRAVGFG